MTGLFNAVHTNISHAGSKFQTRNTAITHLLSYHLTLRLHHSNIDMYNRRQNYSNDLSSECMEFGLYVIKFSCVFIHIMFACTCTKLKFAVCNMQILFFWFLTVFWGTLNFVCMCTYVVFFNKIYLLEFSSNPVMTVTNYLLRDESQFESCI